MKKSILLLGVFLSLAAQSEPPLERNNHLGGVVDPRNGSYVAGSGSAAPPRAGAAPRLSLTQRQQLAEEFERLYACGLSNLLPQASDGNRPRRPQVLMDFGSHQGTFGRFLVTRPNAVFLPESVFNTSRSGEYLVENGDETIHIHLDRWLGRVEIAQIPAQEQSFFSPSPRRLSAEQVPLEVGLEAMREAIVSDMRDRFDRTFRHLRFYLANPGQPITLEKIIRFSRDYSGNGYNLDSMTEALARAINPPDIYRGYAPTECLLTDELKQKETEQRELEQRAATLHASLPRMTPQALRAIIERELGIDDSDFPLTPTKRERLAQLLARVAEEHDQRGQSVLQRSALIAR